MFDLFFYYTLKNDLPPLCVESGGSKEKNRTRLQRYLRLCCVNIWRSRRRLNYLNLCLIAFTDGPRPTRVIHVGHGTSALENSFCRLYNELKETIQVKFERSELSSVLAAWLLTFMLLSIMVAVWEASEGSGLGAESTINGHIRRKQVMIPRNMMAIHWARTALFHQTGEQRQIPPSGLPLVFSFPSDQSPSGP